MGVSIKITKKDLPRLIGAFICCAIGVAFSVTRFKDAIFWYVGLFLLSFLTITVKEEAKGFAKYSRIIFDVIYPVLASFFTVFFMQLVNLVDHEVMKDFNMLYKVMYYTEKTRWLNESIIIIGVYFFFRLCMMPRRFAAIFTPVPFFILGVADFYVFASRGHEILFSDILSARTAMNVMAAYTYDLTFPIVFVILPYALYIIACLRLKDDKPVSKVWIRVIVFAVLAFGFIFGYVSMVKTWSKTNQPQDWEDKGSRYNGLLLNFSLSIATMYAEAPEGYSTEALDNLIANTGIDMTDTGDASEASNIIVIMNESYMQARDYLYMMGCYEDPTPYFNSLSENTVHGYAQSSVYGGNTPNSEFEFLTGITLGYMPIGAVPYTQYVNQDMYSLTWALKDLGYYTTVMHPYLASGWNRPNVYPRLGFDKIMFIDDFNYTDSDLQREDYMTDSAAYRNLIEQIHQAPEGQKTFTFLITMQNHGGYSEAFDNFPVHEYVSGTFTGEDFKVNTYLTALAESDVALQELITALEQEDEKYTLLIFGDHQPQLNAFTNNFAPGKNSSWIVPYIIWTNYDLNDELEQQYAEDPVGISSINYLSLDVLKAAGVELPAYYQVLSMIRDEVPSINSVGYYSNARSQFAYLADITTDEDRNMLTLYRYIQYNLVFDDSRSEFENSLMTVVGEE
ncbi:MAG: LTA synthase family protein [Saccharofermentans sp.]|nr:LTA synthase family protein [Saccharofermentans sp.]